MENISNWEQDLELNAKIVVLLENAEYDFVTLETLSKECDVDEQTMQRALDELEPVVRKAISNMPACDRWYRLASKGLAKSEQRFRTNAQMTYMSLRNNNF